ncbi:RING-H2 finger protein ATL22-like [Zingiber officinale]|uniref:RING-H2 finger protein ATL22-like n=1 Tax=Zingiber officinale TaxID=94328 RepID=UPI001C4BDF1B|nr:RING-H2 finger protein ATL22-like [Zingiber officinale]
MAISIPSTLLSAPLLLLLLLCHAALLLGKSHNCPPSSCGDIHIRSPFRLIGDPDGCGDRRFELVCEGNRAVYSDSHSEKYLVTKISYKSRKLRLMYTGFSSDANCLHLPDHSFKSNTFHIMGHRCHQQHRILWASFMNCTREVESQEYVAVPNCLRGSSSTTYVVVVNDNSYNNPKNSCSILTTVPVEKSLSPGDHDVFKLLRKGFVVHWTPRHPVKFCWEDNKNILATLGGPSLVYKIVNAISFGLQFLSCVCNNKALTVVLDVLLAPVLRGQINIGTSMCLWIPPTQLLEEKQGTRGRRREVPSQPTAISFAHALRLQ